MYKDFEADRDQGNFDKLPELHAVLSGMKARPFSATPPAIVSLQAPASQHVLAVPETLPWYLSPLMSSRNFSSRIYPAIVLKSTSPLAFWSRL